MKNIIVSEKNKPLWQLLLASGCFTIALGLFIIIIYNSNWSVKGARGIIHSLEGVGSFIIAGIGFSVRKKVYIDLENSKFRPTFEVGPIKYGKWETINNYEYVSVFKQHLSNGETIFEVNIWYNTNKHLELYTNKSPLEALKMGFKLSEELDVDLLDATDPHNKKWIDKEKWNEQLNI